MLIKQFMSIICVSSLVTLLLFTNMTITALAQSPDQEISPTHPNIPQATLIYDNNRYHMFPFAFVNNGQLNKIIFPGTPAEEATSNNSVRLQDGTRVSLQFSKQPIRIDAYIADYDGDLPALHSLKKTSLNSFKVEGIKGTYDLEVHAFFPDNQYSSYTLLVNVEGTDIDNLQQRQFATTEDNSANTGQQTDNSWGCDKVGRLDINEISSSIPSKLNVPTNVLDRGVGTMWSAKGIDVMSFIQNLQYKEASVNGNPWIQLDLGTNKLVCSISLAFNNEDNSVNFFTIQASSDGVHFKDLGTVQSTPIKTGASLYVFPDMPYTARYLRLTNFGNLVAANPSIAEFTAIGR
jgi:hypothetical protein